ncbi:MAG TPA: MBL fold metallo-hydrolase [Gemmatimonadales bacterium]|jgi:L-ascorbate metabolism protein UlaG (beta-lactamase superfamily)
MPTRSDHCDGIRYFNPGSAAGPAFRTVLKMLREPRARWPRTVTVQPVRIPPLVDGVAVQATFVGHATFVLQTPAGNLLTDPIWSRRASPLSFAGPRRVRAPAVAFDDLPEIAVVLLSHNHYDHCDVPTPRALERRFAPIVITPVGNGPLLRRIGIRRVEELDWWEHSNAAPVTVVATPARHFSARTPWDRNRALWSGFVIRLSGCQIYFAGDSAYGPHFSEIRARIGPPDLSFLPIGAYEPRWFMAQHHMNPAEAAMAHRDLGSRRSVGMHFGTFQLTTEAIDAPATALAAARKQEEIPDAAFRVPNFGETIAATASPASRSSVGD